MLTTDRVLIRPLRLISVVVHLLRYRVVELGNALVGPVLPQLWQDLTKYIRPKICKRKKEY